MPLKTGFQHCASSKGMVILFTCTIGNTVIKIILRALTGMLSNIHPALQRTPVSQMEIGTGSAGGGG